MNKLNRHYATYDTKTIENSFNVCRISDNFTIKSE